MYIFSRHNLGFFFTTQNITEKSPQTINIKQKNNTLNIPQQSPFYFSFDQWVNVKKT